MTETFAGGHGAPSTVFYSPDQQRNILGQWAKENNGDKQTDWEKAKGMSEEQWGKLSDKEKASLLAAVYVADADKKPGASAALAKLRGWVNKKPGKGGKGGKSGHSKADEAKKKADAAKKKKEADAARAKKQLDAKRVRPDTVNSTHADGYVIGESHDKKTRMRYDKEHSSYVVEHNDGKSWKESRRLSPEQAYNELAKKNSDWYRPDVQPYLKPQPKKTGTSKSNSSSGNGRGNQGSVTTALLAAAEIHTGAMIALIPREDITASLAVDGGEDAEQLHMTEVYLGDAADISDNERARIIDVMANFADRQPEVTGEAFAVSMFNPPGTQRDDGKDRDACVVLGIGGADVAAFHDELLDTLEASGISFPEQHEPRVPHVTLVYTDDADLTYFTDKTGPIVFDTLRVAFAGDVYDIPLGEGRE